MYTLFFVCYTALDLLTSREGKLCRSSISPLLIRPLAPPGAAPDEPEATAGADEVLTVSVGAVTVAAGFTGVGGSNTISP